jgi:hypothetical protein
MLFLRLYLPLRVARDYANVYSERRTLARGTEFDRPEYQVDSTTVFKVYFHTRPGRMLAISGALFVLSLSYITYLLEREWWHPRASQPYLEPISAHEYPDPSLYQPAPLSDFGNCCWFVGVTMMTVGYGEIVPNTWQVNIDKQAFDHPIMRLFHKHFISHIYDSTDFVFVTMTA